jgi:membrane-bound lytic murein transglycosylase D
MNTGDKPRLPGRTLAGLGSRIRIPSGVPSVVGPGSMGLLFMAAALPLGFREIPEEGGETVFMVEQPLGSIRLPLEAAYPDLPAEGRARVDYWVGRFTTDQRRTFEAFLAQEGAFGDMIRAHLRERNMPEELLYLAMIESGFRPRATSRVAAVGVWQFMGPTAQAYGLRVGPWVDERRDPVKATVAALDYLQWLYVQYESWYMATAAYNAGPTRINQILRRQGLQDEKGDHLFWEVRHLLPRETREHVPRMLAARFLAEQQHDHGFHGVEKVDAYQFDQVWVPGGTRLNQVAGAIGVEPRVVQTLNPHLIQGRTPPGEMYPLRVPVGSAREVVTSLGAQRWSLRLADD